jgi:hypothetical protein
MEHISARRPIVALGHDMTFANPIGLAVEWPLDFYIAMRMLLSLALLATSLFVIVSRQFRQQDKNWAYTTIGALSGFWLRDLS